MPKQPKKTPKDASAAAPPASAESTTGAPAPSRRAPAKAKKSAAAPAKKAAPTRTSKARKKAAPASAHQPTDEEIRLRAYFIAERRHRFSLPGDASSDWVEAKRQLLAGDTPK